MTQTSISRRKSMTSLAVCLTTATLVMGLPLSGCVKSPRDFLTSFRGQRAAIDETVESAAEGGDKIAEAEGRDSTDLLASRVQTSSVSQSEQEPSVATDEFGGDNLLDRILKRRKAEQLTTTDPFIEADKLAVSKKTTPSTASMKSGSDGRRPTLTIDELLAQVKQPVVQKEQSDQRERTASLFGRTGHKSPDDDDGAARENVTRFASNFDSRLARLKAELDNEADTAIARSDDKTNPFTEFQQGSTVMNAARDESRSLVSSVSLERNRNQHPLQVENSVAKARVRSLLQEAHADWESWKLEEAYRKALAAQELAVLEGVDFDASEQRPSEMAQQIAADIRRDSLKVSRVATEPWDDQPESSDDSFPQMASRTFDEFAAGSSNFGWKAVSGETSMGSSAEHRIERDPLIEPERSSPRSSGVNLLPPSNDDFPSDAQGADWQLPTSTDLTDVQRGHASGNSVVNLAWPEETTDSAVSDDAHTDGPALVRFDTEARDAAARRDLSQSADFDSHVAANRSRVLQSAPPAWSMQPRLEGTVTGRRADEGHVQLAVAPPVLLGLNDTRESITLPELTTPGIQAPSLTPPLASVWQSKSLWFVMGLVLLVVAMRLLSRRSSASA